MLKSLARPLIAWAAIALISLGASAEQQPAPRVKLETSMGSIVVELTPGSAPQSVQNFLEYVDAGFYSDTLFHRVIDGFMIQGGGFSGGQERKQTGPPIQNEADNGLGNVAGTIAMARTGEPHSATSQFFINLADNDFLDHRDRGAGWGYAVFGRVVEGMDVVRAIGAVPTGPSGRFRKDAPLEPVLILSASRVEPDDTATDRPADGESSAQQ